VIRSSLALAALPARWDHARTRRNAPEDPVRLLLPLLCLVVISTAAPARTLRVERGPVERVLVEAGDVQAVRSRDLVAPGDWRAEALIVELATEGTRVAAGDTLVRFDTTTILEEIRTAESEVERRRAEIAARRAGQQQTMASLRSQVRSAEFAAEQAELRLERMEFAAETEREAASLDLARAELQRSEAAAKLEAQATLDSLDLVQLQTGLVQARANLEREREQIERMVLLAPSNGLVIHGETDDERKVREGDEVSAGTVVVRLPDLGELQVELAVHEIDRVHLREGQPVRVGFDAFGYLELSGAVSSIAELSSAARRGSRIQRFDVVVTLEGSDPRLRPGMSARAEIVTARRDDVLRVPRAALARRGDEVVVVRADGTVEPVRVGLVTPLWVELLEGPPPGTELRTPSGLRPFAPLTGDDA